MQEKLRVKAFYRRALALEALQRLEDAEKDINLALKVGLKQVGQVTGRRLVGAGEMSYFQRPKFIIPDVNLSNGSFSCLKGNSLQILRGIRGWKSHFYNPLEHEPGSCSERSVKTAKHFFDLPAASIPEICSPKTGGPEQRRPRRDCPAPACAPCAGHGVFMGARAAVSHGSCETPCALDWWNGLGCSHVWPGMYIEKCLTSDTGDLKEAMKHAEHAPYSKGNHSVGLSLRVTVIQVKKHSLVGWALSKFNQIVFQFEKVLLNCNCQGNEHSWQPVAWFR